MCRRSGKSQRTAVARPERVSVRDGQRAAPGGRAETVAPAPAGPDRLRQDDRGRRAGHVGRLRARPGAEPDAAAGRRLRGRGGVRRAAAAPQDALADVRAALFRRPHGQSAGRRRLATVVGGPFPRRRRLPRPADVHKGHRVRRLIRRLCARCKYPVPICTPLA